jgi:hypothetical protein
MSHLRAARRQWRKCHPKRKPRLFRLCEDAMLLVGLKSMLTCGNRSSIYLMRTDSNWHRPHPPTNFLTGQNLAKIDIALLALSRRRYRLDLHSAGSFKHIPQGHQLRAELTFFSYVDSIGDASCKLLSFASSQFFEVNLISNCAEIKVKQTQAGKPLKNTHHVRPRLAAKLLRNRKSIDNRP